MEVAAWLPDGLTSFDTETTGVDVLADRIVTADALDVGHGGAALRGSWLFNPGIEIPASASAIHGVTTERAQREGTDPKHELPELAACLERAWAEGRALIVCNAPFDLTLVQAELRRYSLPPLKVGPVLDPLTIDRGCRSGRFGGRNLTALAQHYGVEQSQAHNSRGDALTAARVVWKQARKYTELFSMSLREMQTFQANAHASWAREFERYLRSKGSNDVIEKDWPVKGAA